MSRMLRALGAILAWFCIATLLAQAAMLAFLWNSGRLDRPKVARLAAVLQGIEVPAAGPSSQPSAQAAAVTTVSLSEIESARATRFRQLELREQSLQNALKQIRFETKNFTVEKERFDRVYSSFKEQLSKDKVDALTKGSENARLLLESIKPKQSKELIVKMLEAEETEAVVALLEAMPIAKRAKIAAEFKTEEESLKLSEILRRIRQGLPDAAIIDEAARQLEQPGATP
jgi:hypothetical protein